MPKQKDLKRVVRARMRKTGESYTTARSHLVRRNEPATGYAALAGRSDATILEHTGRDWSQWVALLDRAKAREKPHREIAAYVSSTGTPSWWSQTVTVGYERIRGLRERGQRRDGAYEASKSRTFAVPVAKLFDAFAKPRVRGRWLPAARLRTATPRKTMRLGMPDGTIVAIGFIAKGTAKSSVAVQHTKLPDRATAAKTKTWWAERFDALAEMLSSSS